MVKPLVGKRKRGHVVRRQKALEPQLVEDFKPLLLLRGVKPGQFGGALLQDLKKLKPRQSVMLSRKNEVFPFDDASLVERLCQNHNCGLFALVSHSKKRPNNLVMGRLFNGEIIDLYEFGVEKYLTLMQIVKLNKLAKGLDTDSSVLFQGSEWEDSDSTKRLKSFLLDFFKPRKLEEASLTTLDHVIVLSLSDGVLRFRSYVVSLKKSKKSKSIKEMLDVDCPEAHLTEMGPRMDLKLRRTKDAPIELMKLALKTAKIAAKKVKNVSKDHLDSKVGVIHMNTEDKQYYHNRKEKAKLGIE